MVVLLQYDADTEACDNEVAQILEKKVKDESCLCHKYGNKSSVVLHCLCLILGLSTISSKITTSGPEVIKLFHAQLN